MIKNTTMKFWPLIKDDPSLLNKFKEPPLFVFTWGPNSQQGSEDEYTYRTQTGPFGTT